MEITCLQIPLTLAPLGASCRGKGGGFMSAEYRDWLKKHQEHLKGWSSDEIAHLSILCGFEVAVVCGVLSTWIPDILTRTTLRQREAYFVDRELKQLEEHGGNKDLDEQWWAIRKKQGLGRDFDE